MMVTLALTATFAHGLQAITQLAMCKFVQQRVHQFDAGCVQWVVQHNCTAIDVSLRRRIPALVQHPIVTERMLRNLNKIDALPLAEDVPCAHYPRLIRGRLEHERSDYSWALVRDVSV